MADEAQPANRATDSAPSLFRCVSMGTSTVNKKLKTDDGKGIQYILNVMPHEKLAFADGEVTDSVDTVEYTGKDASGNAVKGNSFVSNGIDATWLPEPNRKTPPDVRRGERITLWQFAKNDKYYWRCENLDEDQRRLETIVWAINADPNNPTDLVGFTNCYFIEWSSHKKSITLMTSQANGEFCTYNVQFDMANGRFVIEDNVGNHWLWDSKETIFQFLNAMGTLWEMDKRDINMFAPDNINLKAGKNIILTAGTMFKADGGGSAQTQVAGGTTVKTPTWKGSS